jgi:hypothetical protein
METPHLTEPLSTFPVYTRLSSIHLNMSEEHTTSSPADNQSKEDRDAQDAKDRQREKEEQAGTLDHTPAR